MRLLFSALPLITISLIACSSGSSPAGAADASTDVASKESGPSTSCNTLTNSAAPPSLVSSADTAPAMTGGTIVDGTYVLSSITFYQTTGLDAGATADEGDTISVSGSTWQLAGSSPGGGSGTSTLAFSSNGTSFTLTQTCFDGLTVDGGLSADAGSPYDGSGTYTASATQILLAEVVDAGSLQGSTAVSAYTKQ